MKDKNSLSGVINRRSFIKLVAVAGGATACWQMGLFSSPQPQIVQKSKPLMGTIINLTVYGPDREQCEEALQATFDKMHLLETKLSRHMLDSDVGRLNSSGLLNNPDPELLTVLEQAQLLNGLSNGSFDITILPLLKLFENAKATGNPLKISEFNAAKELIGQNEVSVSTDQIALPRKGMGISLDGIGKGYIVDQGVDTLKQAGFSNVYVEAGGDLMVSGLKNNKDPWRIGIRNPRPAIQKKPVVLSISNKAVATSGDYFNSFSNDYKKHHIIDPRNGFSPPELASVTVTAPSVVLADGLATAVMALGRKDGLDFIESMEGCETFMIGKDLIENSSSGFFS